MIYRISNSKIEDVSLIQKMYAQARELQKLKGAVVWGNVSDEFIVGEINESRQWKMEAENQVACVWAITFSDAEIWEERNTDAAIYIHRIATNAMFSGNNFVGEIVKWAKPFAEEKGARFIRMDTVGKNDGLIRHYTKCGFDFLGMKSMKSSEGLPAHYAHGEVCLFEMKVPKE